MHDAAQKAAAQSKVKEVNDTLASGKQVRRHTHGRVTHADRSLSALVAYAVCLGICVGIC